MLNLLNLHIKNNTLTDGWLINIVLIRYRRVAFWVSVFLKRGAKGNKTETRNLLE